MFDSLVAAFIKSKSTRELKPKSRPFEIRVYMDWEKCKIGDCTYARNLVRNFEFRESIMTHNHKPINDSLPNHNANWELIVISEGSTSFYVYQRVS